MARKNRRKNGKKHHEGKAGKNETKIDVEVRKPTQEEKENISVGELVIIAEPILHKLGG